ncbi:MAG: sigma 54-dependent transcriptional regulator, partial [Gammaproteobacteria bacterium]|nr:sigma 54-dependent transcriptional regulator [Gammaproteobacteria bacterium]
AEIARLRWLWQPASDARNGLASTPGALGRDDLAGLLGEETVESLDLFDQLQLAAVLHVCRQARTLSDAGRQLFQASRAQRTVVNDADRLRKYLARFGLDWDRASGAGR